MAEGFVLSTKDKELLQRMVRAAQLEIQSGIPSYDEYTPTLPQVWLTPSGGIPARTGTHPNYTLGKAECVLADVFLDGTDVKISARDPAISRYVYNTSPTVIAGSKPIQVKYLVGRFPTVDVGDCA